MLCGKQPFPGKQDSVLKAFDGTDASAFLLGQAESLLNFFERKTLGLRINEEDHKKLNDHHDREKHEGVSTG